MSDPRVGPLSCAELDALCRRALTAAGAAPADAAVLAAATVEAERVGNRAVGVAHLFDYLDGYRAGRIAPTTRITRHRRAPAVLDVEAGSGLAQVAFAAVVDEFQAGIAENGLAALWIRGCFTCGELGYYPRELARRGSIALAMANSPALMSIGGAPDAVLGTNPLAYAVPRPGRLPLVIDQASSATAFVNIRRAAEAGDPLPPGWALDAAGEATRDPSAALAGTLLPFGSHRGGNVALLVEILATLAGGSFSLDAAPFDRGSRSPGVGVFVLGIDPSAWAGSLDRLWAHLGRLTDDHGVRLPALELTELPDAVTLETTLLSRLRAAAAADHEEQP